MEESLLPFYTKLHSFEPYNVLLSTAICPTKPTFRA